LSELLEAGKVYRGMTKQKLAELVEGLQPQVDQLAEALALELSEKRDYVQMLLAAHQRMASLTEDVAGKLNGQSEDDRQHAQLLAHTRELSRAMTDFLNGNKTAELPEASGRQWAAQHAAHDPPGNTSSRSTPGTAAVGDVSLLVRNLTSAINRCRERRSELSLLFVEPNVYDVHSDPRAESATRQVRLALAEACSLLEHENVMLISLGDVRTAAIFASCDRRAAAAVAQNALATLGKPNLSANNAVSDVATTISVGLATVSVIPRNFDPVRLVESAERCLSAARACGISTVKSIEV
jgi:hypothetical protein